MQKTTEEIFVEIIRQYMSLAANQVIIRNQNFKIPEDDRIYVIVGMVDARPYSAKYEMVQRLTVGSDPQPYQVEITSTQVRENIQIDIMSRSTAALLRRNEVYLALNSILSKQAQEEYNFKIAKIPANFVNTSAAEGGSNINRYTITMPCLVWYQNEIADPPYFESFRSRIDTEETIGTENPLIEFEIDPDTPPPPINP